MLGRGVLRQMIRRCSGPRHFTAGCRSPRLPRTVNSSEPDACDQSADVEVSFSGAVGAFVATSTGLALALPGAPEPMEAFMNWRRNTSPS